MGRLTEYTECAKNEYAEAYFDECMKLRAEMEQLRIEMRRDTRNRVIEECARVALEWPRQEMGIALSIGVAIRALKDKP